jgi:hypothetical protein
MVFAAGAASFQAVPASLAYTVLRQLKRRGRRRAIISRRRALAGEIAAIGADVSAS